VKALPDLDALASFYDSVKPLSVKYEAEVVEDVRRRRFEDQNEQTFLRQYVYVVLNTGMLNQVAEKMFTKWLKEGSESVRNQAKRNAIKKVQKDISMWWDLLQSSENKLAVLSLLPFIGPVTKYHLARNLGLDTAKPDRHLTRLAEHFDFPDVQSMCEALASKVGERIGVVDLILWRACNLGYFPEDKSQTRLK